MLKPQQRVTGKLEQKKIRAIGVARKWGARTWGFYFKTKTRIKRKTMITKIAAQQATHYVDVKKEAINVDGF